MQEILSYPRKIYFELNKNSQLLCLTLQIPVFWLAKIKLYPLSHVLSVNLKAREHRTRFEDYL